MYAGWWSSISEFGCHKGLDASELKRIRLTNQIAVVLVGLILVYVPVFAFAGSPGLGWITFALALVYLAIPFLHKHFNGSLSVRYLFIVVSYTSVFIYSLALGRDTGIHLFYVGIIAMPFVLLEIKHKRAVLLFGLLPLALLGILEFYGYQHVTPLYFSPDSRRFIYLLVLPSAALTTFLYTGYFYMVNQKSEKDLNETIQNLHQSQQMIEDQQIQLASASRLSAIGELSGNIAHEINNPLTIILGYTEQILRLVQAEPMDKNKIAQICERIIKTISRITLIVLGMRKLSRESADDPMEQADLAAIIDDAISVCRESLHQADIDLRISLPKQPCICRCQPLQISQVLLNLIQNAKDAVSDLDEKWIAVDVHLQEKFFVLSVRDSGHITDPITLQKIGEPFFTTKPPGKGTGLGLSISRRILTAHGGTISLDKEASSTTFVVQLPRANQGFE